jgi:hypothetical protein
MNCRRREMPENISFMYFLTFRILFTLFYNLKLRNKNNMKYPISLFDFVADLSTSHLLRLLSDINSSEQHIALSARQNVNK